MSKRILVVDDDSKIVDVIKRRLEQSNYEVITAYDGEEGLDKVQKGKPDLIILDIMLPKVDGYTVCRRLKSDRKYKNVPVIMLTARVLDYDEETGRKAGADSYITKPFDAPVLLAVIEELLSRYTKDPKRIT